jgi:hypothetical protein
MIPAVSSQPPALRQFLLVLQRIHDGGDALGEEVGADHDGEGQRALNRPGKHDRSPRFMVGSGIARRATI